MRGLTLLDAPPLLRVLADYERIMSRRNSELPAEGIVLYNGHFAGCPVRLVLPRFAIRFNV